MRAAMLDTDILSEFLRGNPTVVSNVQEYVKEFGQINMSVITYYEILNGLIYKDAKKQLGKFEEFVGLNNVIPLTIPMVRKAASIQAELRSKGLEIGHTDTLIAGTALTSDMQLVTNNTAHFKRIKGIELANWTTLLK